MRMIKRVSNGLFYFQEFITCGINNEKKQSSIVKKLESTNILHLIR